MPSTTENPEPIYNYSRRPLSEEKKRKILAMLMNGSSRRKAALCVGCSPSTIARYVQRDPDFLEQVINTEQFVEINALRNIRHGRAKSAFLAGRRLDARTEISRGIRQTPAIVHDHRTPPKTLRLAPPRH